MSTSESEVANQYVRMRHRPSLSVCIPADDGRYIKIDETFPTDFASAVPTAGRGIPLAPGAPVGTGDGGEKSQDYWRTQVQEWKAQAVAGNPVAAQNVGVALYKGELGVPRDEAEAYKYFRIAAAAGLTTAQFNIGWCYCSGAGVPQSWAKAVKWWRRAAEKGHGSAARNLGLLFSLGLAPDAAGATVVNHEAALEWYLHAAGLGNVKAMMAVANCYATGLGVAADEKAAAEWRARGDAAAAAAGTVLPKLE
jgi:TPR repeat protein